MTKKPIYIVITPFFPSPNEWSGAYCFDFVCALKKLQRYDVRVFVPSRGQDYNYQGVHVYTFPTKNLPSGLLPFFFAKHNAQAFLKKVQEMGIDVNDVAVCHGHTAIYGIYPLALKKLNPHCQTILHHHDPGSFGLRCGRLGMVWLNRFLTYFPLKRIHEAIDCHVFISRMVEKSFRLAPRTDWSCYKGYHKAGRGVSFLSSAKIKKSIVLHNGVDVAQFNAERRNLHDGFVMGCIANFADWKDQFTLLKAVNILRDQLGDWKLRLIGSGSFLAICQKYIEEQGLDGHVTFEKEVDHAELPDFYRSINLFVLPSYFEGFGCVFTEAWACGTPFITCTGQGMDDLILPDERNLWLCEPKNPQALAEKILSYYQHRQEQYMACPVAIDELVEAFVEKLQ